MNDTKNINIKGTIKERSLKIDKNGYEYLLLKVEGDEEVDEKVIFVFSSKVGKERWEEIEQNREYTFTVEAGNNGSNLLIDFKE